MSLFFKVPMEWLKLSFKMPHFYRETMENRPESQDIDLTKVTCQIRDITKKLIEYCNYVTCTRFYQIITNYYSKLKQKQMQIWLCHRMNVLVCMLWHNRPKLYAKHSKMCTFRVIWDCYMKRTHFFTPRRAYGTRYNIDINMATEMNAISRIAKN